MSFKQKIIIRNDPTLLAKQAAEIFVAGARGSMDKKRPFTVAISGGFTPRRMYKMPATEPYIQNIPWQKIHIFRVDERCVPRDSPESNNTGTLITGHALHRRLKPSSTASWRSSVESSIVQWLNFLYNNPKKEGKNANGNIL